MGRKEVEIIKDIYQEFGIDKLKFAVKILEKDRLDVIQKYLKLSLLIKMSENLERILDFTMPN